MARRSKAMATLTLLTTWTIWNERNARVFQKKSTPPQIILRNLKEEARLWVLAGAKRLSNLIRESNDFVFSGPHVAST